MHIDLIQLFLFGGAIVLSVFFLFFWRRLFLKQQDNHSCHDACHHASISSFDSSELEAISGEDVQATQLNLAKAYLETNNIELAKSLLDSVLKHGDFTQQKEAEKILQQL